MASSRNWQFLYHFWTVTLSGMLFQEAFQRKCTCDFETLNWQLKLFGYTKQIAIACGWELGSASGVGGHLKTCEVQNKNPVVTEVTRLPAYIWS
eukprot:1350079-Amphidinium_carterae.1